MSTTKERPILFSAPMVRAILDGNKTQTRRVVKRAGDMELDPADPYYGPYWLPYATEADGEDAKVRCPYGLPGDRLWVRETFARVPVTAYRCSTGVQQADDPGDPDMCVVYREGWERSSPGSWRPSIFMPRWASRITLEITDVRVQRLQEIAADECRAEGHPVEGWRSDDQEVHDDAARDWYQDLWIEINGLESWDANPWVWALTFKRLQP